MSLEVERITAIMAGLSCCWLGMVILLRARRETGIAGPIITGLSAIVLGGVFLVSVLFTIPVSDIRHISRVAVISYALNYAILYRHKTAGDIRAIIDRLKPWTSRRS